MATAPINNDMPEPKDIQILQPDAQVGEMRLYRPPEAVLADAQQAAVALRRVIDASPVKPVKFGPNEHLRHEHWATLGHFFGYCTKIESTRFVEFPTYNGEMTRGFEATAVLLNERTGVIVGRVECMCLDEEENWGEVAEYEWQNGRKVQVGTVHKPLFQLRSMAETRASAKAFRMKLGWVAVLAGYSQTPAEEMRTDDRRPPAREELPTELRRKESTQQPITPSYEQRRVPPRPQAQPEQQQQAPARQQWTTISGPQARRFYAMCMSSNKTKAMIKDYLQRTFGIEDDRQIPADRYKEACAWAERSGF